MYLSCLAISCPSLAEETDNEIELPKDSGYLFIRIKTVTDKPLIDLKMTNLDTGDVVNIHSTLHKSAGLNAWTELVVMPSGHYFFSEYNLGYTFTQPDVRQAPSSTNEVFEIAPGVINYVGDWRFDFSNSDLRGPEIDISHEYSPLERLSNNYPRYAEKFEIFLSIMGRVAISVDDFVQLINEHEGPGIE